MTSVVRHTSVQADAEALRCFVNHQLANTAGTLRRGELVEAIDRLESLALATAKRSGVGTFVHIIKERMKTDTHCGRPIEHVNTIGLDHVSDFNDPTLCKRCVQLYQSRQPKASPTPAGSGSDSDMYPGAPGSQSREPGESKARQGEGNISKKESAPK